MPQTTAPTEWTALKSAIDVAALVPEQYVAYRPLVNDGLRFFLRSLPRPRLAAIVEEQLQMVGAPLTKRIVALLHHCPTLHKLGQVVARDRRLASDLRRRLQRLESLRPTTPLGDLQPLVRRAVGGISNLRVAPRALAEGSVAAVIPFTWCEAPTQKPHRGVLKVLKPRVEEHLGEELEIWSALGGFLEARCVQYDLPVLDYAETLESVSSLLANEIRLDREQAHLTRACDFYSDSPRVFIPRVFPFSTDHVTAMERIHGCKVTDPAVPADERRRLSETIVETLLAKPFWVRAASAFFHGDPHAGNLFFTRDGRLAILDWSLVAELPKSQLEQVVQIAVGALTLDAPRVCRALGSLGRDPPDESALRRLVSEALDEVRRGTFPGFEWTVGLLDRAATLVRMGFDEDLILFRKSLLTLSGVVKDVSTECATDGVFLASGLTRFCDEIALRALAPPGSRSFGSHVSNWDLFEAWTAVPLATARWWSGALRDQFAAVRNGLGAESLERRGST